MADNTNNNTTINEEIFYIYEYFEIISLLFLSLFRDGFILLKNIKRDSKKYDMHPINLIYNSLIKYPLLGFRPSSFFIYHFYKKSNRNNYKDYVSLTDHIKIAKANKHNPYLLNNKLKFHLYLRDKSVIPGLIAHYNSKKLTVYAEPKSDKVILKPTNGKCGNGIKVVKSSEYKTILEEISEDYIVEEYLEQHPQIDQIFNGTVNTIRLITLKKNNQYVVIKAILRVGNNTAVFVDNNAHGGITIGIDMEKGILKNGYTFYEFGHNEYRCHPITKNIFYGAPIPFFKEAQELAIKTHKCLPMFSLIGWDIAITKNGPVIIEGNRAPDLSSIQPHYPIKKLLCPTIFKNV